MQTIDITPNWAGMRAWVLHVAKTDPMLARKIASEMGREAPKFLPGDTMISLHNGIHYEFVSIVVTNTQLVMVRDPRDGVIFPTDPDNFKRPGTSA